MTVWGFSLFLAISLLLILLSRQRAEWGVLRLLRLGSRYPTRLNRLERLYGLLVDRSRRSPRERRRSMLILVLLLVVTAALAWKGYWVLVLMLPLLALASALVVGPRMSDQRRFVLALVFTSFLLLVGVELFYLKDHLDGDTLGWWRMNTLFKFHLQVWVMLGVALGASLPEVWQAVERWRWWGWRWAWTAVLGALLVAVSIFALVGTPARVCDPDVARQAYLAEGGRHRALLAPRVHLPHTIGQVRCVQLAAWFEIHWHGRSNLHSFFSSSPGTDCRKSRWMVRTAPAGCAPRATPAAILPLASARSKRPRQNLFPVEPLLDKTLDLAGT